MHTKRSAPFSTRLLIITSKWILAKAQKAYCKAWEKPLPIILVAGTVGKSSQTLLLKQLFEHANWHVLSGASREKCLNSLSGIGMTLGNFFIDFEDARSFSNKINYLLTILRKIIFQRFHFDEKTIMIYEIGFNEQYESEYFIEVFGKSAHDVVITSLTAEHTQGFYEELNTTKWEELRPLLPKKFVQSFEESTAPFPIKNIAIEQLNLLSCGQFFVLPEAIGDIQNSMINNLQGAINSHVIQAKRESDFSLTVDNDLTVTNHYLLPLTFAKTVHVASLIADQYGISHHSLQQTLNTLQLPQGRFSLLSGKNQTTIVDSSYNSDPASLSGFLDTLVEVIEHYKLLDSQYKKGQEQNKLYREGSNLRKMFEPVLMPKHYIVLGEMRELGSSSNYEHLKIIRRLLEIAKDYGEFLENIYLLGKSWLNLNEDGITKNDGPVSFITVNNQLFKVFNKAGDICELLSEETLRPHNWIWVKGSQNTIFSEIIVEHLLINPEDSKLLCRRGSSWDTLRKPWTQSSHKAIEQA